MGEIKVTDTTIPALLTKLHSGEWLTPEFQREFVWNTSAVVGLVNSIIDAKPIGMVTLWEQENESDLKLEHISVPDWRNELGKTGPRFFGDADDRPGRYYAILDGKQRSTAIALAFGGLRSLSGNYRHAGRYYLNVAAEDPMDRVSFIKETDVIQRGLDSLNMCISKGLFPLAAETPEKIYQQWMKYTALIGDPNNYPGGILPDETELARRNQLLQTAFDGIISTKIAVYIVPSDESLAEICEVFETLNTTGTKVSTVDLIHSWLYADTVKKHSGPLLLRDEIDNLGELVGAVGWSSTKDRPELVAQFAAAIHVALDSKPTPRSVSGKNVTKITSIKSSDLLAVPDLHWTQFFQHKEHVAKYLSDLQILVSGGHFTMSQCPYPAIATIYLALRWHYEFEHSEGAALKLERLDYLFKAFFWRNALTNRYDQGFLTKVGRDIKDIKEFLAESFVEKGSELWRADAQTWLDKKIPLDGVEPNLRDAVLDGSVKGALRKAALLPLLGRATVDLLETEKSIRNVHDTLQLHHIYPKDWCNNNDVSSANDAFGDAMDKPDWINSAANLMPLSTESNQKWRKNSPALALSQFNVTSETQHRLLNRYFIDEECINYLKQGEEGLVPFLKRRSHLLIDHLKKSMNV